MIIQSGEFERAREVTRPFTFSLLSGHGFSDNHLRREDDVSVQSSFDPFVTKRVAEHLLSISRCRELSLKKYSDGARKVALPFIFSIFCGDNQIGVVYIAFGLKLIGACGMGQKQTGARTRASKVTAVRSLHER
jgi:hypothetical protein